MKSIEPALVFVQLPSENPASVSVPSPPTTAAEILSFLAVPSYRAHKYKRIARPSISVGCSDDQRVSTGPHNYFFGWCPRKHLGVLAALERSDQPPLTFDTYRDGTLGSKRDT